MRTLSAVLWSLASAPALALGPSEVFEKVAPSVWAVRGLDAQERPFSYGSAVVVGPGQLITNCHVLAKAKSIQVRKENMIFEARLDHADAERDLCLISAKNLSAPPVATVRISELKVGQRAFAIGNPEKLDLTLSEGLISGLRSEDDKLPPVQTTAPISPGSSGGGLFDDQGRLIGVTTLVVVGRQRVAQNLNFAVPAEWIGAVPERAKEQLAARRTASTKTASIAPGAVFAPAHAALPPLGATWKYRFSDEKYRRGAQQFTIRVMGVSGWEVREELQVGESASNSASINAKDLNFTSRRLSPAYSVLELGAYFYGGELSKSLVVPHKPESYPGPNGWTVDSAKLLGEEQVEVPAGSFATVKVEVEGSNLVQTPGQGTRFLYTAWYAAAVGRYVKIRHQSWNRLGSVMSDELVELIEHKPN